MYRNTRNMIKKGIVVNNYFWLLSISLCGLISIELIARNYDYQEKPFVILICSYNTAAWVEKNLSSIAAQHYTNYRIVYVDDGSQDGTADCVERCAIELGLYDKLTLIRNTKRRRKLANMYEAIHQCLDNEIIILLDGDDWLENDAHIFKKINAAYHEQDCWFTYSQYRNEPKSEAKKWGFRELGYSAPVPTRVKNMQAYRGYTFVFMHLRTFYTWLFKRIQLEDLISHTVRGYKGDFYPAANDLAIVFPMVEMAHDHVHFMKDILCVRNVYSNIVGFKVDNSLQLAASAEIRKRQPYPILPEAQVFAAVSMCKHIDACIFFTGDVLSVVNTVRLLNTYVKGLRRIVVLYQATRENNAYMREIQKMVSIVPCAYGNEVCGAAYALKQYCATSNTRYLLMCTDVFVPDKSIPIKQCVRALEKTGAFGFYFGQQKPISNIICDGVCAWHFKHVSKQWLTPHTCAWGLYRAHDVVEFLSQDPTDPVEAWKMATIPVSAIGLMS